MMPSIKLINISDNREKAWIFSRPGFDHSNVDMEEIGSMDMSLNSLCMLTFEITSSIIFRDWLFTIRPIFPWARSSRSAPLTTNNTDISGEFMEKGLDRLDQVLDEIDRGVPQDQAREGLPLSMSTSYTVSMDFRTVCGAVESMREMDISMYSCYGRKFEHEICQIPGFSKSTVRSFQDSYALDHHQFGKRVSVKFALMSQMIRSSNAIFRSEIWNLIANAGYMEMFHYSQSDMITLDISMEPHAYHKLMRLRSHWFADWSPDMWGTMVGEYVKDMTVEQFWNFIPNGAGRADPYHRDMISRVNGEEHNLPCPIMLEYPDLVRQRLEKHGPNMVIDKYTDLVSVGYIHDNPENKLRIQYEQVIANK